MSSMPVSVVIPTYSRPVLIKRALQSALQQSHPAESIVIVDDGSPFDYVSQLERDDSRVRAIRLGSNGGPSVARNAGLSLIGSGLVAFLDDDDEYHPTYLESAVTALSAAPSDVALCWSGIVLKQWREGQLLATQRRDFARTIKDRRSLLCAFISIGMGHGVTVRRECFDKIGGFAEDLRLVEDTEWFVRFLSHGYLPTVIADTHVTVHCHEGSRLTNLHRESARLAECETVLRRVGNALDSYPYLQERLRHATDFSGRATA